MEKELKVVLANEHILYMNLRNAHWNIKCESFIMLHKLFEDQYTQVNDFIDTLSERFKQLGLSPLVGLYNICQLATAEDYVIELEDANQVLTILVDQHVNILNDLTKIIKATSDDPVTQNILLAIAEAHAKMKWILESHLTKED